MVWISIFTRLNSHVLSYCSLQFHLLRYFVLYSRFLDGFKYHLLCQFLHLIFLSDGFFFASDSQCDKGSCYHRFNLQQNFISRYIYPMYRSEGSFIDRIFIEFQFYFLYIIDLYYVLQWFTTRGPQHSFTEFRC